MLIRCVNTECPLWKKCARGQDHPDDEALCRSYNYTVEEEDVKCRGFVYHEDAV